MFGVMMFITTAVLYTLETKFKVVLLMREGWDDVVERDVYYDVYFCFLGQVFARQKSLDADGTTMRMRSRDALPTRHAGASRFALGMLVAATVVTQVCMLSRRCLSAEQPSSQRP